MGGISWRTGGLDTPSAAGGTGGRGAAATFRTAAENRGLFRGAKRTRLRACRASANALRVTIFRVSANLNLEESRAESQAKSNFARTSNCRKRGI